MKGKKPAAILPEIRRVKSCDLQLVFIGEPLPSGSYVLRFHVAKRLEIRCGRFDCGKPVTFEQGNYLYIGSAMAEKGPSSLAGRLMRHATRLSNRPSHAIRRLMKAQFPAFGLGHYEPAGMKNPKWNVDWPLNEMSVRLRARRCAEDRCGNLPTARLEGRSHFIDFDPFVVRPCAPESRRRLRKLQVDRRVAPPSHEVVLPERCSRTGSSLAKSERQ